MFSSTVIRPSGRGIWKVRPTPSRAISCEASPSSRSAPRLIWPPSAGVRPLITLKRVVLPAPFGPMRPVIEPSATLSVQPASASTPPKRLVMPVTLRRSAVMLSPVACFCGSAQAGGSLTDLCRRVLASERRSRHEMLAHGEAADENGLEPDLANESLGCRDRFRIVARYWHSDLLAWAMRDFGEPSRADRVERADDVRAGQPLGCHQPRSPLRVDRFDEVLAVATRDGVAHVDHEHLLGEGRAVILADLLHRGVGNAKHDDVAKGDGLLDRAGLRERPGGGQVLQRLRMPRREHHRVAGLGEELA